MARKKKEESTELVEEVEKPKKQRSAAYSKTKGSAYERQIVNELKDLTGNENICTARSESKKLDDMKIDISDPDNVLPCYIQTKKTQTTPSVKKINAEVGLKDKPLCILWNIQEKKEGNTNITSNGEYAIIPKSFFYELLKNQKE
jgi:ribonuclease BN (tRNA processing enzyme)